MSFNYTVCGFWAGGSSHICYQWQTKTVNKPKTIFFFFLIILLPFWLVEVQPEWATLHADPFNKGYPLPPSFIYARSQTGSSQLKVKKMLSVVRRCFFPWSHHKPLCRVAGCNKRATVSLAQYATLLHSLATHANDRPGWERCGDVRSKLTEHKSAA